MQAVNITPSAGHHLAFAAITALTVAWLWLALRLPARALAGLLGWQALMGGLALTGYFLRFDQPWRVLPTVGLGVGAATWLACRPWHTDTGHWLAACPPWALAALHSFRLPLEWLLYSLFLHGVIGRQMTFSGYNFDIFIGLSAPIVALLLHRCGQARWARQMAVAWNLLGLLLLLNIVVIAVLSIPFSFQVFTTGPGNRFIAGLPFVWLPCLLVPLALWSHLCSLRLLLRANHPHLKATLAPSS